MVEEYQVQIDQDHETGVVVHEAWRLHGKLHRIGAPALIHRDAQTGVAFAEEWHMAGFFHRTDGPARIFRDAQTGEVIQQWFFVEGREVEGPDQPTPQP